jgi:hypothetical protein
VAAAAGRERGQRRRTGHCAVGLSEFSQLDDLVGDHLRQGIDWERGHLDGFGGQRNQVVEFGSTSVVFVGRCVHVIVDCLHI